MDPKDVVLLALQVSILSMVFGFGLKATSEDLLYLLRRPGLLARSFLAVLVIMPVVAVVIAVLFGFQRPVQIVLLCLAMSPVPPILPRKETGAGGQASYALGLLAILSLLSIVAIPVILQILALVFSRPLEMSPGAIAGIVMKTTLLPLLAGMAVRAFVPALAKRIEKPVALIANVLLPVAVLALLSGALSSMWAAIGSGALVAMLIFTVAGLAVGHVLGGPDPGHAVVLALSTACRHPAIALTIAATNFPNLQFGPIMLLYLVVNAIAGIPYVKWQRRRAGTVRAARAGVESPP
jgi:BASS family bile acid:Na+ symporter